MSRGGHSLLVFSISWIVFTLSSSFAFSQSKSASASELKKLSLDELVQLEVVTASRKPEPLSSVATSIDVLTQERIKRSGATTIPDALRLAAGLNVARFDGRTWAISARGFNLNTSNKLEIVMDGRVLHTPLFSGIFWDVQDYVLDDIDRIEVVRGPGATLWGANAVNGVINIITASAKETQGTLIEGGGGDVENAFVSARYGGKIGDSTYYRAYFKGFNRDGLVFPDGTDAQDGMRMGRGGFRFDFGSTPEQSFTVQGDYYNGRLGLADRDDSEVSGGNVLGRWNRTVSERSSLQFQMYFDNSKRKVPLQFQEEARTLDLQFSNRFELNKTHDFVWGLDYRISPDETEDIGTVQFVPEDRTLHLFSAFIQDEISLVPNKYSLIVGAKFEKNTFTNLEALPNIRFGWTFNPSQTLWTAVSRAIRVPSRTDTDLRVFPAPGVISLQGDPDFLPEQLTAYELGDRIKPTKNLYVDLSTFYNSYNQLISIEAQQPGQPLILGNGFNGTIYGATIESQFQPEKRIRMIGSITFLHKELTLDPDSHDVSGGTGEGNDPGHYWSLQTLIDPLPNFQFDVMLRSTGELENPVVPSYVTMDLHFAWQATKQLQLSVVGQNLFQDSHPEFGPDTAARKEVQRGVYGQFTWTF